jgi:hypothetical protein
LLLFNRGNFGLAPHRVLTVRGCSFHTLTPWSGVVSDIDAERLLVRSVAWKTGDAQAMEEEDTLGCPEWPAAFGPMPSDRIYGAFNIAAPLGIGAPSLPQEATLGDCSLEIRSDGSAGFLVYGKPATRADAAEVRVIAEGLNRLVVQVYDPTAVQQTKAAKGKSWIHAPHLEIWTSEDATGEDGVPAKTYRQIGVGLDGAVEKGVGDPVLPKAARWTTSDEQGRIVTILRIEWPDEYALLDGAGLVYSQSVGGKQARLVSTAGIVKNKPLFLPGVWQHQPEESGQGSTRCEVRNGVLSLVR